MARVAIVTGGTRGIGEAISVGLKNAGYTVAANYMGNDERAKAASVSPRYTATTCVFVATSLRVTASPMPRVPPVTIAMREVSVMHI